MNSPLVTMWIMCLLMVDGDDIDDNESLCDCYSVSLQSISGVFVDGSICYTYSTHQSRNEKCQTDAVGMILGVCEDDNEIQFTQETLRESITSIQPQQAESTSYATDPFVGIQLEMSDRITLCMNHINYVGATSHRVQYILNNNDVITCSGDDVNQHGLPCKASTAAPIEAQENIQYVAEYVERQDGLGHGEYQRIDVEQNVMHMEHGPIENESIETTDSEPMDHEEDRPIMEEEEKGYVVITPHSGLITKELHKRVNDSQDAQVETSSVRVGSGQYGTFALVASMIFIGLNLIFCICIALRKSSALDSVPYSNEVQDGGSIMFDVNNIDEDNPSDYISDMAQISNSIMNDIIAGRNDVEDLSYNAKQCDAMVAL